MNCKSCNIIRCTGRICFGPAMFLGLLCGMLGVLFLSVSATPLGLVFIGTGLATSALCFLMGVRACRSNRMLAFGRVKRHF
jgi:hypothetical protein